MDPFTKIVNPYTSEDTGSTYVKIRWREGKLSITGTEGPRSNGNAKGASGQIVLHWEDEFLDSVTLGRLWTREMLFELRDLWNRWHLNNMRPGCEHQRAEGWAERPIDPTKPLRAYGRHFDGQRSNTWNMLAWVRPYEHPDGLLTRPCDTCGYRYGSAWLTEEVPEDVLQKLHDLPSSTRTPAWV